MSETSSSLTLPDPTPRKTTFSGTLYRGNEGMWSWVLHRIWDRIGHGELQALGSLAGMPSLSLPGVLARCARD